MATRARRRADETHRRQGLEKAETLRLVQLGYHVIGDPCPRELGLEPGQAVVRLEPVAQGTYKLYTASGEATLYNIDGLQLEANGDVTLWTRVAPYIATSCLTLGRRSSEAFDAQLNAAQVRLERPQWHSPERRHREALDAATSAIRPLMAGKAIAAVRVVAMDGDRVVACELRFSDGTRVTMAAQQTASGKAYLAVDG